MRVRAFQPCLWGVLTKKKEREKGIEERKGEGRKGGEKLSASLSSLTDRVLTSELISWYALIRGFKHTNYNPKLLIWCTELYIVQLTTATVENHDVL